MITEEAREFIKVHFKKGDVVCLTGAGISADSGIPIFRGQGGLWEKYDPQIYANPEGLAYMLKKNPRDLANFVVDFYSILLKANPNQAHLALAVMEKENLINAVITQNIDNLHVQAGNRNVIELHGNAFRICCTECPKTITLEKDRLREMVELLKSSGDSRPRLLRLLSRYFPNCSCGSRMRIDVVFFGESLPQDELLAAYKQLASCKLLLLVGTSMVVYPAASLPLYAKDKGAKLLEINNQETSLSDLCDLRINGKASEVLPEILNILDYA